MSRFSPFFLILLTLSLLTLTTGHLARAEETADDEGHAILEESLDGLAKAVRIEEVATRIGLGEPRKIKIAILDNGFRGFQMARGRTIPQDARLRKGPIAIDPKNEEVHGLKMAEVLSNLIDRTNVPYDLHLFQTFGYSNLESAVNAVIREKFDIVLYSQVWEFGGNGDGRGFINALVSTATAKGILWVNAAGNFGKSTYRAPIDGAAGDWAYLPGRNNGVQVRCDKSESGKCVLRAVLSWNSFADDVNTGTDKDLDLFLADSKGNVVKSAELIQRKTPKPGEKGASLYPRETIEAEVREGTYSLHVKIRSKNFSKTTDELRIVVSGPGTELLNHTDGETLLPPADNPTVLTVGANDSALSAVSRLAQRPEVTTKSFLKTEDDTELRGTSQASASIAARLAVELAYRGPLDRASALQLLRGGSARPPVVLKPVPPENSTVRSREIGPTQGSCYTYTTLPVLPRHVLKILQDAGVAVETTAGPKIFVDEAPVKLAERLGLAVSNRSGGASQAILVADATGLFLAPLSSRVSLAADTVEIVRTPEGATYCPLR